MFDLMWSLLPDGVTASIGRGTVGKVIVGEQSFEGREGTLVKLSDRFCANAVDRDSVERVIGQYVSGEVGGGELVMVKWMP